MNRDKCEATFARSGSYLVPDRSTVCCRSVLRQRPRAASLTPPLPHHPSRVHHGSVFQVTYLCGSQASAACPTIVLDHRVPLPGEELELGDGAAAFISPCQLGKHIWFEGDLLHGATTLTPPPLLRVRDGASRVTFMVNVWDEQSWDQQHRRRPIRPLPEAIVRRLPPWTDDLTGVGVGIPPGSPEHMSAVPTMSGHLFPLRSKSVSATLTARHSRRQLRDLFFDLFTTAAEGREVKTQIGIDAAEASQAVADAVAAAMPQSEASLPIGTKIMASLTVVVKLLAPSATQHPSARDVLIVSTPETAATELLVRVSAVPQRPLKRRLSAADAGGLREGPERSRLRATGGMAGSRISTETVGSGRWDLCLFCAYSVYSISTEHSQK